MPGSAQSRLLVHPLAEPAGGDFYHNGGKHWRSQSDPEWQTLKAWVLGRTDSTATKVRIIQTNAAGDNVHIIDPATNTVVGTITGIEAGHGAGVAPDGSRIYVSDEAQSTLDVADGRTFEVVKRIPLSGHPNNMAVGRDGRRVYVGIAQAPGGVDVIDTGSLQRVKTIPTKGTIHNAYVTPDGKFVVAGSIPGKTINVIDARTEEPAWVLEMDLGIRPMTFNTNPDGSTKWIFVQLTGFNGFAVVDFSTRREIARIKNPDLPPGKATVPQGSDPSHGMAVTADGKTLVVCSRLNNHLYLVLVARLEAAGRRRARRQGRRLGDAHARRQNRLRGQPGDERRFGRGRRDDERSDAHSGRGCSETQRHRCAAVGNCRIAGLQVCRIELFNCNPTVLPFCNPAIS